MRNSNAKKIIARIESQDTEKGTIIQNIDAFFFQVQQIR
jgi:hypothetical protein